MTQIYHNYQFKRVYALTKPRYHPKIAMMQFSLGCGGVILLPSTSLELYLLCEGGLLN